MTRAGRHPLFAATRIIVLGTLASRVLGMLRESATASLLGGGLVMDAFAIGLRIPNLLRRLFAEGALTASYLPVVTRVLEEDRRRAWQLASVLFTCLTVLLVGLLLAGEALCGLIWLVSSRSPDLGLLLGLTASMLPYAVFICVAAQVAATLNTLGHFGVPAAAPTLLNLCGIAGAWWIAPRVSSDTAAQAYVLAACVLVAGVLQLGVQVPVLLRLGFRFDFNWAAARGEMGEVVRAMGPMVLGLAVTQINTLMDSLVAWCLSAAPDGPQRITWLGGVDYPMRQGAAAAIYFGERMYMFPLGILGLAVATAIFPLLSRHAARGHFQRLGADMTLGLRLVLCLGVPAGVGLMLLDLPLVRLIYEYGAFDAAAARRAAGMVASYAVGVWAYCALPIVVRGFYAMGDRITPVRVGAAAVALDLALNLTLIWPLAERGLALSTAASAAVQVCVLAAIFSRRRSPLAWRALRTTCFRAVLATAVMAAVGWTALAMLPDGPSFAARLVRVAVPLALCGLVYCGVYHLTGGREISLLLGRRPASRGEAAGLDWFEEHYEE
ncbi:MAG TPA: murein biosynthesis integral membrane protein MurJ [Thermoguttaceae bacterium]|nr:murein biosynthesis integral membrane protein MurJ [Thermoguttaceae bacterium]